MNSTWIYSTYFLSWIENFSLIKSSTTLKLTHIVCMCLHRVSSSNSMQYILWYISYGLRIYLSHWMGLCCEMEWFKQSIRFLPFWIRWISICEFHDVCVCVCEYLILFGHKEKCQHLHILNEKSKIGTFIFLVVSMKNG